LTFSPRVPFSLFHPPSSHSLPVGRIYPSPGDPFFDLLSRPLFSAGFPTVEATFVPSHSPPPSPLFLLKDAVDCFFFLGGCQALAPPPWRVWFVWDFWFFEYLLTLFSSLGSSFLGLFTQLLQTGALAGLPRMSFRRFKVHQTDHSLFSVLPPGCLAFFVGFCKLPFFSRRWRVPL